MTKRLEDLLNLPESNSLLLEEKKVIRQAEDKVRILDEDLGPVDISERVDQITDELPVAAGLGSAADKELDRIANKAIKAYDDLMDLGMNIEMRYSARIFEVAGQMLKTSLDAKSAKINKKLRMLELQLKKEKNEKNNTEGSIITTDNQIITDRNSILDQLKGLKRDK
jgi:hypothetical protein